MYKVEKLALGREVPMAATAPVRSRVWLKVGVVAERIALLARIDDANAVIRVKP